MDKARAFIGHVTGFLRQHWGWVVGVGFIIVVAVVACLVYRFFDWLFVTQPHGSAPDVGEGVTVLDRSEHVNNARQTNAQIIGGLIVLVVGGSTAYLTWRRVGALEEQVAVAERGQITERFTRAIDQLGANNADDTPNVIVRAGGIRSLERLATESPDDFWPIIDILSAYVRHRCPSTVRSGAVSPKTERAAGGMEVVAALSGLGRLWPQRPADSDQAPKPHLDLNSVLLRQPRLLGDALVAVNLYESDLTGTDFTGMDLTDANLISAFLDRAILADANLTGAFLIEADLTGADLFSSYLTGAYLNDVVFTGATLIDADLTGADLTGADLVGANLTHARYNQHTKWPEGFTPPDSAILVD